MSDLHPVPSSGEPLNFNDYQRPEKVAEQYPHFWTKWGLIRECRQAEYNGMQDAGAVVKFKGKIYCHVPSLVRWFEQRYVRSA